VWVVVNTIIDGVIKNTERFVFALGGEAASFLRPSSSEGEQLKAQKDTAENPGRRQRPKTN